MSNLEVKVYPAEQVKGNNLGGGSVRVMGIVAKFSIWLNPKFSQGFAITFPYRKGADGKIINEVYFIDKEMERQLYDIVAPQIAGLMGGASSASAGSYQQSAPSTPNPIQRQDVNPQSGAPTGAPW